MLIFTWVFFGSWNSSTLATWCKELTHRKRLWCWEGLGAGGEGDDRGWDGWMASPTRWTWVWVNSGRWWWTWRPGVLRFMGSQRVAHDWGLNWTELNHFSYPSLISLPSSGHPFMQQPSIGLIVSVSFPLALSSIKPEWRNKNTNTFLTLSYSQHEAQALYFGR